MSDFPEPIAIQLPDLPNGWHFLSCTVLRENRLALLGTNIDVIAGFKQQRQGYLANAQAKIWVFDGINLDDGPEFNLLDPFPIIDQFSDGRWLLSYCRSDGKARTRILDMNGVELQCIELGDGIQHLKIDDEHRIWVGWFDEGVFGNDNWDYPGLKWPPSSTGIAAFNVEGDLVKHASLPSIADCYALNVFDNEVWSCTYTDFPIWQMNDLEEKVWNSELSGISALAVLHPYVLTAGGYRENTNRISLVKLTGNKAKEKDKWQTALISEKSEIQLLDGRANFLHLVTGNNWYCWDVAQFIT